MAGLVDTYRETLNEILSNRTNSLTNNYQSESGTLQDKINNIDNVLPYYKKLYDLNSSMDAKLSLVNQAKVTQIQNILQ